MNFSGPLGQVMRHSMDPRLIVGKGHMSSPHLLMQDTLANLGQFESTMMSKGAAGAALASQYANRHPYVMGALGITAAAGIGGLGVYSAYNALND